MATLRLTAGQVETLRDYFGTEDLNTVALSMREPYGDLTVERNAPTFTETVVLNSRGEYLRTVDVRVTHDHVFSVDGKR